MPVRSAAEPPTKERRSPRRRAAVVGVGISAGLGYFGIKIAVGLLAASVVGAVASSLFGGPWERLPSDTRSQLERRLEAALGDSIKGLSDADASARVDAAVTAGQARLDDPTLVRRFRLLTAAVASADGTTCAAFARADVAGHKLDPVIAQKLIDSLDTARLSEWFEINVEAIEAQQRGAPATRSVPLEASQAMFIALDARVSASDTATLIGLANGTPESDAAACAAERSFYVAGLQLDPTNLAVLALSGVAP